VPSPKPVPSAPTMIVPFAVRTIAAARGARELCCPGCLLPLNLIQPDENEPTRLLGTCDFCSKWAFLVELEPEWRKALLVELPDSDSIRRDYPQLDPGVGSIVKA
jgi:hypothetical protein